MEIKKSIRRLFVTRFGGRKIDIREISTKRIGKTFELGIKSTRVGLYNIALNTVQKEHILLFDNSTVFADIIYDPSQVSDNRD